jgi:hypothetical protein
LREIHCRQEQSEMAELDLLNGFVKVIHDMPDFRGCMVGYEGTYGASGPVSRTLYDGNGNTSVAVVIEEIFVTDPTMNADTERWATRGRSPENVANPAVANNKSKLGAELKGLGWTCGMVLVSTVAFAGATAAEVPTGGMSTFLVIVTWTGMVTSIMECSNAAARVAAALGNPEGSELEKLDNDKRYQLIFLIVDALNVASAIASLPSGVKSLANLIKQRAAAKGLTEAVLRHMNRAERAAEVSKLMKDVERESGGMQKIVEALNDPAVEKAAMKLMSGKGGHLAVMPAEKIATKIAKGLADQLQKRLFDFMTTGAGIAVSGAPSKYVGGAASGSVNFIINLTAPSG